LRCGERGAGRFFLKDYVDDMKNPAMLEHGGVFLWEVT